MSYRNHSGSSLEEVAKALGMSRQNVQLIERRALNKLRIAMGSTFRGRWSIYDMEGLPEPGDEGFRTEPRRGVRRSV